MTLQTVFSPVSRAQCCAKRCAADPGSSRT